LRALIHSTMPRKSVVAGVVQRRCAVMRPVR
jgi:hypothetical protein